MTVIVKTLIRTMDQKALDGIMMKWICTRWIHLMILKKIRTMISWNREVDAKREPQDVDQVVLVVHAAVVVEVAKETPTPEEAEAVEEEKGE